MSYCIASRKLLIALLIGSPLAPLPVAKPKPAGDVQTGKIIFEKLGCQRCHGSVGEGMIATTTRAKAPLRLEVLASALLKFLIPVSLPMSANRQAVCHHTR